MNILLWVLQILVGLLFIGLAGVPKLFMTAEQMHQMAQTAPGSIEFSLGFMKFIGVCETLGGLGLILPGVTGIKRILTPIAALGLLVIMIGAVVTSLMGPGVKFAIPGFVVGLLLIAIAYGRRNWR